MHIFDSRPCAAVYSVSLVGGGEVGWNSPTVRPLMWLDSREKNERVAINEGKPMIPQLVISEVRSYPRNRSWQGLRHRGARAPSIVNYAYVLLNNMPMGAAWKESTSNGLRPPPPTIGS